MILSSGLITIDEAAYARDEDLDSLLKLSLEDLGRVDVTVASNKNKPAILQPGVISIITEEDIKKIGARDLSDILRLVPGFHVEVDTNMLLGIAVRGISGNSGKVLLLIDEIPQNSASGGYIYLGNHYAADQIKKIEIIRGPGSAKYGGNAELAVIKVTTKGAEQNGHSVSASIDFNTKHVNNEQILFQSGKEFELWSYAFSAIAGNGDIGEDTYTGLTGQTIDLHGNSGHTPIYTKLDFTAGNFRNTFNYDHFTIEDRILLGEFGASVSNGGNPFQENYFFSSERFNNRASYQWEAHKDLTVTPSLLYSHQVLNIDSPESGQVDTQIKSDILQTNIEALYNWTDSTNILVGLDYATYQDELTSSDVFNPLTYYGNGTNHVTHVNHASYFQYETATEICNITLGGRYESHDYVGDQFVPRVAFNKRGDNWHAKLMYNEAFRIAQPNVIANAQRAGQPIEAETTRDIEAEIGYQISANSHIQGNLFWLEVEDFIAYDPTVFSFVNSGEIQTWGGELILQHLFSWGKMDATYSYYHLADTDIGVIEVDQTNSASLGLPNHKFSITSTYNVNDDTTINMNGTILGPRYVCKNDPTLFCGQTKKLDVEADLDLYLHHTKDNFDIGIGINNILNTSVYYAQPYKGGLAPIPGLGRSAQIKISYKF